MDYRPLKETELLAMIDGYLDDARSYFDSELAKEREEALKYYRGEMPPPLQKGRSKYVSQDVFDVVESLAASLLETFSGNRRVVEFTPLNAEDVELSRIATEYTNYVFYHRNNGYEVLHQVILDGLLGRIGVAKAWWQEEVDEERFTFENVLPQQLDMLLAEDGVELADEPVVDATTGTLSGELVRRTSKGYVRVEALAPEEFLVTPNAKSLEDADIVAHRVKKSVSELLKEGYDRKLVRKAYEAAKEDDDAFNTLESTRNEDVGLGLNKAQGQEQTERFWVYESYIKADMEGEGIARLWRVVHAGDVILEKEVVEYLPFFVFTPLTNAHSLLGISLVDRIKPIQNAKTVLTRSILDHTVMTNNPRLQVVKGTLLNPRELIDDRLGGIVNVTRPDGLIPLPQSLMNPYVFNTLSMLDEDKEDATGVSRLSQGLNKDAISKQNSADLVNNLATLSMQRQKIIARNLAERFLKPLFIYIYNLAVENDDQQTVISVAGNWVPVRPSEWVNRYSATVAFTIGYNEADKEAQKLIGLYQLLAQDPAVAPMFGPKQRHVLLTKVMENLGIKDANKYLMPPEAVPPQQDPMQQLQIEQLKKQLEIQERQTRVAEMKAQVEAEVKKRKLALEEELARLKAVLEADKLELQEEKQRHQEQMDAEELAIVKRKAARDLEDMTAIASVSRA